MTGAEIKQKRTELGLSQSELALLIEYPKSCIGRWEIKPEGKPLNHNIEKLKKVFALSKEEAQNLLKKKLKKLAK